jgi:hypothetical protein
MPETINLKFIAAPLTGNQLKGIDSDSAAAEIVGGKVQICCTGGVARAFRRRSQRTSSLSSSSLRVMT